jgi:hypothetical protein
MPESLGKLGGTIAGAARTTTKAIAASPSRMLSRNRKDDTGAETGPKSPPEPRHRTIRSELCLLAAAGREVKPRSCGLDANRVTVASMLFRVALASAPTFGGKIRAGYGRCGAG